MAGGNETGPGDPLLTRSPELLQVEAEIARGRDRVSRSVLALRQAVAKQTDWREWVRERPGVFIAAAFAVGLVWGHRSGRRSARY
jgi:hypothetical protein